MIERKQLLNVNDGSGLFDTAGILRSAIEDINGLLLQGIQNWSKATDACGKIAAVIKAYEEQTKKEQEAREKAMEEQTAKEVKLYDFSSELKGGDNADGNL